MMIEMISNFYPAIATAIILLWFIKVSGDFERSITRYFIAAAVVVLALSIFDIGEMLLSGTNGVTNPSFWRVFCSYFGYNLRVLAIYIVFLLVIRNFPSKIKALSAIPYIINLLVMSPAFFSKLVFYYDAENSFHRGPLGIAPFVTAGIYLVALIVVVIFLSTRNDFSEKIIVIIISINAIISVVLVTVFTSDCVLASCTIINILFYYLYMNTTQNNEDELTKAFIRRKFYIDVEKHKKSITAVISVDLNNLKKLNDENGHKAGDAALKNLVKIINRILPPTCRLYRMGGDEFNILCLKMKENQVDELIGKLHKNLDHTICESAFGYSMYNIENGIDVATTNADKKMYLNKEFMKTKKEVLNE